MSRVRWGRGAVGALGALLVPACLLVTDLDGLSGGSPPPTPDTGSDADAIAPGVDAGREGSTTDSGGDAAPSCDPTAAFAAPVLVPDVNSGASERSVTLTADELEICVESARSGGRGSDDIWCGTRASRSSRFGALVNLGPVNATTSEFAPAFSADGLVLFFTSDRAGTLDLWSATRATRGDTFGTPVVVSALSGSADDVDTSLVGGNVYFDSNRSGNWEIYLSEAGGPPARVDAVSSSANEYMPVASGDELTLYFNRGGLDGDIFVARRASRGVPFGAPVPVTELNTTAGEWPRFLSPDQCRLYLGSNRAGGSGTSIWMAERKP